MSGAGPYLSEQTREPRGANRVRQAVTVRRVDPWTVLKLSLVLYFCFLLVVMLGLSVFWFVLTRLGAIKELTDFLNDLELTLVINGGNIARALFLVGVLNVVLCSGINVFLAFLYNLVADAIGGLRLELDTDE